MPKAPIIDLFRVPSRFLRSVQLERDFNDELALEHYIVTPSVADAFKRVGDGLRLDSGRRAWRITGDYGVGKSSFALVLARLLSATSGPGIGRIAGEIGWDFGTTRLWPILLTGSRDGLVRSLATGIGRALSRQPISKDRSTALKNLVAQCDRVQRSGSARALEELLESVRDYAEHEGAGVLLVIDELGKLLEHASQHPDSEDVFVLQRFAETAARSGKRALVLIGLLHQGFNAYAERLPSAIRHEWEKVAGRFDEIVFDQPLAHTAALVAGALNVDGRRLGGDIRNGASLAAKATAMTGWLGGATTGAATLDAAQLYPLHPTLLPVLVRFFARFGQHERSLFGFLLSSEPFGLQAFSAQPAASDTWYRLSDFYDYVRATFGHRLAGGSYRSQWIRIVETVDSAPALGVMAAQVLKCVAILNLLDAEDLLPTERALEAAFSPYHRKSITVAVRQLVDRGVLFRRAAGISYRLWPQSSVNLDTAFSAAMRALGPLENVAAAIEPYVNRSPVLARRHYVERGTLRYFEVRVCQAGALAQAINESTEADGIVVVALANNEEDRRTAAAAATAAPCKDRADVLVSITEPLLGLAPELQDARCWDWISVNYPELASDSFTATEVARQRSSAHRLLAHRLEMCVGIRDGARKATWFREGKRVPVRPQHGLSAILSAVSDQLYPKAPLISNELLNRNTLSSAAAAARMRLIEGLFNAADQPLLGIDAKKAPPEKSMYLSVVEKGAIHVKRGSSYHVVEPGVNSDPLRLRPSLEQLASVVKSAHGDRVSVSDLLAGLQRPPYGVRSGVAPLLLAVLMRTRPHELAVYENGTFLHRFGPSDFLRLTKAPSTFEIQHCHIKGVRAEVFELLAATFARDVSDRTPDLLDVVTPLCQFAAQLPEYTRRATLGGHALSVRNCLLAAREPVALLFRELPEACDVAAFSPDQRSSTDRIQTFVTRLHDAIGELRAAYPELIARLVQRVGLAIGEQGPSFDRGALAARAARVSLAAKEPRLRTFALRLRDPGLSDEAWIEALGSFVVAKPPSRWLPGDEARFSEEISALADLFYRVESAAFGGGQAAPTLEAIRVNLTRGDGEDLLRVVQPVVSADANGDALAESFARLLPQDQSVRVHVLTTLLWNEFASAKNQRSTDKRVVREQSGVQHS